MASWIRRWRRRRFEDNDLAEELRAHLAIETRQLIDAGQSPGDAEQAARRAFGNRTRIQEATRETWGWAGVERFFDDARFGLRMLRKTPVWTAMICGMLALGIGLSTAIFSVVYGVLLQPLPYPHPERIMALWSSAPAHGYTHFSVNAAEWMHWQEQSRSFEQISLTRAIANFNLTGEGPPQRLQGARTSWNLPQVLGVTPLMGRTFTEPEQRADAKVALLSYRLWQRQFGRDPAVLGRRVQLNGEPFEIIAVMPRNFRYPSSEFELWTPLYIPPDEVRDGLNYSYISAARLKPGVSVRQAQAEMTGIMRRLMQQFPLEYQYVGNDIGALVEPLAASDATTVRSALYVLLGSAGCLLAIGCMNLGILLLARGSARAREMTVRVALGASGARLRRQMLAELLPLAVTGAAGGVLLAAWMLQLLLPLLPANTPRVESIGLHAPVLAFAICASLAVVLLAGLLPARVASGTQLAQALHRDSRTVAGGGSTRNLLVIAQVALTLVVLFSGTLFARSLGALLQVKPGFSTPGVLTMHLAVTRAKYREDADVAAYYDRILQRVRSLPGVAAAGIVNRLALSGIAQTGPVEFENKPGMEKFETDWRSATPGYIEAMGIPVLQGRSFNAHDRADSQKVGLIDEQLAHRVFGNQDPIGKRFRLYAGAILGPWTEIVGVVGHVLNDTLEKDYRPQVYWLESQRIQDRGALVVKTEGRPESFTTSVVEQIRAEDADQTVYDVRSMDQWVARSLETRDLTTGLVGLFGGASLLLACLGLYGVVSYSAGLRLREFGIRMALGARPAQVRGLVLKHATRLALWGSAVGLALAWPVSAAIRSLLYGVNRADFIALTGAPLLLIAIAAMAAFSPARRAARTDPAITLRTE